MRKICPSMKWRANAAAIFLIAQALVAIVFVWATREDNNTFELFFGCCCFCLMIAAGGIVLWSIQAKEKELWPLYAVLIVLALGGVCMAVAAGHAINQLRTRCPGVQSGCNGAGVVSLAVRVAVSLPMLCIYGGLIFVFFKSKALFKPERIIPELDVRQTIDEPLTSETSEAASWSYTTRSKDRPPSYSSSAFGQR